MLEGGHPARSNAAFERELDGISKETMDDHYKLCEPEPAGASA